MSALGFLFSLVRRPVPLATTDVPDPPASNCQSPWSCAWLDPLTVLGVIQVPLVSLQTTKPLWCVGKGSDEPEVAL